MAFKALVPGLLALIVLAASTAPRADQSARTSPQAWTFKNAVCVVTVTESAYHYFSAEIVATDDHGSDRVYLSDSYLSHRDCVRDEEAEALFLAQKNICESVSVREVQGPAVTAAPRRVLRHDAAGLETL